MNTQAQARIAGAALVALGLVALWAFFVGILETSGRFIGVGMRAAAVALWDHRRNNELLGRQRRAVWFAALACLSASFTQSIVSGFDSMSFFVFMLLAMTVLALAPVAGLVLVIVGTLRTIRGAPGYASWTSEVEIQTTVPTFTRVRP